MEIRIKEDSVEIEGYVNAVERNSKPLMSRLGKFLERICAGAFKSALTRNEDVHVLLNHDWEKDLGSTKQGNLKLTEDNIGLHARAVITDKDVVEEAKQGKLVGWSFGFTDRDVEQSVEQGLPLRMVRDLDLYEVSILDNSKTPAYDGTLITVREDSKEMQFRSEPFMDDVSTIDETEKPEETEERSEPEQSNDSEANKTEIDYSEYENMISEMKGE
jgi:HK97 family phage prohead protease